MKRFEIGDCFFPLSRKDGLEDDGSNFIETERRGPVVIIHLNRPEKRNAVNAKMASQLTRAMDAFLNDDSAHVAVLHGRGGHFCAGADLEEVSQRDPQQLLPDPESRGTGPMGPSRMVLTKPVIAAVEGFAVAGGMELAMMCDLRIVDHSAVFGVYCRRFGVPLIDGGTVRLPQLVGFSRAMDLILTGRPCPATEAYNIGLANRLVQNGKALEAAIDLAQQIAGYPQECMIADRQSAHHATFDAKRFFDAVQFEYYNGSGVINHEAIKGAQRFMEGAGKHGSFENLNDSYKKKMSKL
ncbi:uncharacterized protein LOC106180450 isoform X3 [Lingula anatina]|uniref:Uncharacterized protein LOC106180450 isoform X3 n=1 Tax=Lingula anatina TaxID=7574 RepID=A0A1S3KBS3_LINAN|nr:uncharacterized protein LOC106180450 isoform X3 [Lingula anatina]|eukprot:XP_013419889.1 uncharacterized protein LOC106180450 isoform X3 [Lingula anatina]